MPEARRTRAILADDAFSDRMTESSAREQLGRIERAGFDKLHFGWAGSLQPGKPHYYRVHGPLYSSSTTTLRTTPIIITVSGATSAVTCFVRTTKRIRLMVVVTSTSVCA
jgi:hypothetical protein